MKRCANQDRPKIIFADSDQLASQETSLCNDFTMIVDNCW
jgi:hypothetical protein